MDEPEVNGQVVPAILRKHFPNDTEKMRALLADPSVKGDGTGGGKRKELWERGLEIASDATIKRKVEMNRLPDMAARSMHTDPHCCLLYTSPSPRDGLLSRMPSSA